MKRKGSPNEPGGEIIFSSDNQRETESEFEENEEEEEEEEEHRTLLLHVMESHGFSYDTTLRCVVCALCAAEAPPNVLVPCFIASTELNTTLSNNTPSSSPFRSHNSASDNTSSRSFLGYPIVSNVRMPLSLTERFLLRENQKERKRGRAESEKSENPQVLQETNKCSASSHYLSELSVSMLTPHINSRRHLSALERWIGISDASLHSANNQQHYEEGEGKINNNNNNNKEEPKNSSHIDQNNDDIAANHHDHHQQQQQQPLPPHPLTSPLSNYTAVEINGVRMLLSHCLIFPDSMFGPGATLFDLTTKMLIPPNEVGAVHLFANHRYTVVTLRLPSVDSRPPSRAAPPLLRRRQQEVARETILGRKMLPAVKSNVLPVTFSSSSSTSVIRNNANSNAETDNQLAGIDPFTTVVSTSSSFSASLLQKDKVERKKRLMKKRTATQQRKLTISEIASKNYFIDANNCRESLNNHNVRVPPTFLTEQTGFISADGGIESSGDINGGCDAHNSASSHNNTIIYNNLYPTEAQERLEGCNFRLVSERILKF